MQALSNVLALCDGTPEEKCKKTIRLYDKFKEKKYKYGTGYELPTLGVHAISSESVGEIVSEAIEIDTWLSKQNGLGVWGVPKKRLMYAAVLAQNDLAAPEPLQAATIGSVIALIVAQQAAICAAVIAVTSASAAASN